MRLPPHNDSLNLHIRHAIYLAYIQRHPELRNHTSLIGRGWEMINGHCRPVHYIKVAFPAELPQHPRKTQEKNK